MPDTQQETKPKATIAGTADKTIATAMQSATDMLRSSLELSATMAAQNAAVALRHADILEQALIQAGGKQPVAKK